MFRQQVNSFRPVLDELAPCSQSRRLAELELAAAEAERAASEAAAPAGAPTSECILCMDAERCVVLRPCRHLCLCEGCAKAVMGCDRRCPLCRKEIEDVQVVYT